MKKLTTEQFIEKSRQVHGNRYDYSKVNYINSRTKVTIICPKHGEFLQKPKDHIRYAGCPKCSSSKGELYVGEILNGLEIKYISQHPIKYNNTTIHVDFLVEYQDKKYIIEYNGRQHYIPIEHFGGELKFQKQIKRDKFLENYCKDNNIILIIISYTLNNKQIKKLLSNIFKK